MADSKRPATVAGMKLSSIDSAVDEVSSQPALNESDFAKVWAALQDPSKTKKAEAWLNGNDVSEPERHEFYSWVNAQPKSIDLNNRPDSNIAVVGGVGIAPEDLLMSRLAVRGVTSAVKAAPTGAKMAAGAMAAAGEAAPMLKYEAVKRGLMFAHVPEPLAVLAASAVTGASGRGKVKEAPGLSKVPKPPPTLSEQLGVSPMSTGATLDTLPNTPIPAPGREPVALAFASQNKANALDSTRAAASELGVASDVTSPNNMPLGVGDEAASLTPGSRARIPVPVRLRDSPPPVKMSNFEDMARELGLDPGQLHAEPPPITTPDVVVSAKAAKLAESDSSLHALDDMPTMPNGGEQPPGALGTPMPQATRDAMMEELMNRIGTVPNGGELPKPAARTRNPFGVLLREEKDAALRLQKEGYDPADIVRTIIANRGRE